MIKGSQLVGRAVVDMDAAEKLGKIKEVIVQQDGERVAGFVVVHGENILGSGGTHRTIPASALNAIGPDAIVVHGAGVAAHPAGELEALPRMSDVIGHKMVTQSGRLLGSIDDILIDEKDGAVIGFVIGEGMKSRLENMFSPDRAPVHGYVRADADLQVGNDLIVVPDDAFVAGELDSRDEKATPVRGLETEPPRQGWSVARPVKSSRTSIWRKRTAESGSDEVEGWIPGDFAQALSGEQRPTEATGAARTPKSSSLNPEEPSSN
ncbi:MAG: PRC-barrel domain-containing protein [Chthoniobacterales bacterium]